MFVCNCGVVVCCVVSIVIGCVSEWDLFGIEWFDYVGG